MTADTILTCTTIMFHIVLAVATIVTGWWAVKKSRLFREERPFLKVTQSVSIRPISENMVHVHTAAILHNMSKVKVEPKSGYCVVHGIPKLSNDDVQETNTDEFMVKLNEKDWGDKGFLEPGESHKSFFDFIVSNEYLAYRSYVAIDNPESQETVWDDVEIVDNKPEEAYDA